MPDQRHILSAVEEALGRMNALIVQMASMAENNLANAIRGLLERNEDLCNCAIADDAEVDALEKKIDEEGHALILRFSPMARDLRRVISSMKASTALERISDHAVSIARRARLLNAREPVIETGMIRPIYELAASQLKRAVDAFHHGDLALALRIVQNDDPLDIAHYEFIDQLTDTIAKNGPQASDYVALIFITRLLERIGDQAVNIAEDAIYLLTATDIRHGGELPQVKA
jgi:phosphate transport system protein